MAGQIGSWRVRVADNGVAPGVGECGDDLVEGADEGVGL
jgi:hypothetical protein